MPHHSSEVCSAGLDYQSIFPQTDDKIPSASLCPDCLKHELLAVCMGEDSGPYVGCAVHLYQTCVRLEHAYVQIASECVTDASTRAMLSGVRNEDGRPVAFYTLQSLLHATATPFDGLQMEMGLPVNSVHGEIRAKSL